MALTATIHVFTIQLADMDRGVYENFELRVARQPSETAEFMLARLLAYCLEYQDGIALTEGVAAVDEPAVLVRDLTGRITAWIEIGAPDAERLHRGSKLAGRAAVYTHRDPAPLLAQYAGRKIHRGDEIPVYELGRAFIAEVAPRLERRASLAITVTERQLYLDLVDLADRQYVTTIVEHRAG
ncbi:YaeQ family protein [Solimonas soli]|uniref:YaeQ family protein n=1 Tax=Solimonas soli TaxID=413479 RepID=UPI0004862A47|nr:YaeQ family protein [Solimonas soli]